ncbi:hypothetical protein SAMN05421823_11620 [Catalinimonas alkaloidigena]|uniref:Uncharacterized protein n=1 Tax=Catalinimonas alkaloidigena TaxID=1075417 RepID=A0A1G9UC72_9BACT|nr:hypothetical protein [Catalinimonas alkaloidigena]SDM57452.1 hypothetical protein SAMN05421823_11620 [Catalinimonas alkaloidigena]
MKRAKKLLFFFLAVSFCQVGYAQLNPIKKFDYSLVEGKKLLIPSFETSEKYIKRMTKKGRFDKIEDVQEKVNYYNTIWEEAMLESSYDATSYEIKAFDYRELVKQKDQEAILLHYYIDKYNNWSAVLMVTAPKRQTIASAIINGLDLSSKNDIRLMINMLNESLNAAIQLEQEGDKSYRAMKNKYKERVVNFYDRIEEKTFLVPKSTHKNPEKAAERTADLKDALKAWHLSGSELTTEEGIEEKRLEGDEKSFYWRDFPIYTQSPLITYHYNVIISTKDDVVLFAFLGKKRLKPETLTLIENKIVSKATKYKSQLSKL